MKNKQINQNSYFFRIIRKDTDVYADVPKWLESKITLTKDNEIIIEKE